MISLNFFSPFSPLVWVELSFHNALEKAGIEDFKIHNLRHTFTSNILISGVDFITVRELLGHKTIDMTLRYAHLAPNHKMRAVNILDQVMSQNPPQEERQERKILEFKR
jgi:site-specific recombinase XerD